MSEVVSRVYFKEAAYVGTESYQSLPPVSDNKEPRRSAWTFTEKDSGVAVEYRHTNGHTYGAFVPWANIKGVVYFEAPVQKSPETSSSVKGQTK